MKDLLSNYPPNYEAAIAERTKPDQENIVPRHADAFPIPSDETDLFANTIRLPSESSGARKVLKSSAMRASGQFVFGTNPGRLIQVDSYLEFNVALILSVTPDLVDLRDQVGFKWFDQTGSSKLHFFDFVTTMKAGERTAVIVKEASRLKSERLRREIKMIAAQAVPDFVDRVIVVTQRDINPVDLHNAKLLHDVRHADPEADRAAEAVTAGLMGAVTVADLIMAMKMGSRGFRALARLIRNRSLELLQHEILSYETLVRRAV